MSPRYIGGHAGVIRPPLVSMATTSISPYRNTLQGSQPVLWQMRSPEKTRWRPLVRLWNDLDDLVALVHVGLHEISSRPAAIEETGVAWITEISRIFLPPSSGLFVCTTGFTHCLSQASTSLSTCTRSLYS